MDPNFTGHIPFSGVQAQSSPHSFHQRTLPGGIGQGSRALPQANYTSNVGEPDRNLRLALNLAATLVPDPTNSDFYIDPATGRRIKIFPLTCGVSVGNPEPRNAAEAAILDEPQYERTEYGDVLMGFGPEGAERVKYAQHMARKAAGPNIAQYLEPIPGAEQWPGMKSMRVRAEYSHLAEKKKGSMCVVS